MKEINSLSVDNIRYVTATMISNAKSGHTGICLGATSILYSLYSSCLKFSPMDPTYFNRDRFIMCSGHASALEYCMLHLFGYQYSKEDLINYRKNGSITPGHPRVNPNLGIDSSGGPLGQGLPMAVGMAIAEQKLAKAFNKDNFNIVNHYTYCFLGEGSLMEGLTNEASSLAGTLKLNKLIVLYDSNNITIEGGTDLTFTEDVLLRYKALGWNTLEVKNGNNVQAIVNAINKAKQQQEKPTIIKINTIIGYGTPYENTNKIHGIALSAEDLLKTKKKLKINDDLLEYEFYPEVKENAKKIIEQNNKKIAEEKEILKRYKNIYPEKYDELLKWLSDYYSKNINWADIVPVTTGEATRVYGKYIINKIAQSVPNFICGCGDVAPSTGLLIENGGSYSAENILGKNIHFGIREHAMAGICNGIALHGGFRVACSTYLVFSDYMRHSIRMSALMNLPVIYVLTHDSIGVGEDGVSHQPIEYLEMYRATPNVVCIRPADYNETLGAYKFAFENMSPTLLALTRQKVTPLNQLTSSNVASGAYNIIKYTKPDAIIIGTGSELSVCLDASQLLKKNGVKANVVSMPSSKLFDNMPEEYKQTILPDNVRRRVVVEASACDDYYKYAGLDGKIVGINKFGHTAKSDELFKEFGFTAENICNIVLGLK